MKKKQADEARAGEGSSDVAEGGQIISGWVSRVVGQWV